jgi:hypothetical protein
MDPSRILGKCTTRHAHACGIGAALYFAAPARHSRDEGERARLVGVARTYRGELSPSVRFVWDMPKRRAAPVGEAPGEAETCVVRFPPPRTNRGGVRVALRQTLIHLVL